MHCFRFQLKRHLTSLLPLVLCLIVLLTACARELPPPSSREEDRPKTLVVSLGSDAPQISSALIAQFEVEHPDIHIELSYLTSSVEYLYNRYKSDFVAKQNSTDIICIGSGWIPEFVSQGWLLPLENYFDSAFRSQFITPAISSCTYQNTLYAIPGTIDTAVLYYRSDLIAQPPDTYEEMIALASSISKQEQIPYSYVCSARADEELVCAMSEFIWSEGGDLIKDGLVTARSPEVLAGMCLFCDAIRSNASPMDLFSFSGVDAVLAFSQGDAVFLRAGISDYQKINAPSSPVHDKIATRTLPSASNSTAHTSTLIGWHYAVSRTSKYPHEAAEFIKFITGEAVQRSLCEQYGTPPTAAACYQDLTLISNFTDQDDPLAIYEQSRPYVSTPYYMEISQKLSSEFSKLIRGFVSPEESVRILEEILKHYFVLL